MIRILRPPEILIGWEIVPHAIPEFDVARWAEDLVKGQPQKIPAIVRHASEVIANSRYRRQEERVTLWMAVENAMGRIRSLRYLSGRCLGKDLCVAFYAKSDYYYPEPCPEPARIFAPDGRVYKCALIPEESFQPTYSEWVCLGPLLASG